MRPGGELNRVITQGLEHKEARMTGRVVIELSEDPIAEFLVEWPCLEAVGIQPYVPASALHRHCLCRLYQSASPTLPASLCRNRHRGEISQAPAGVACNTANNVAAVVLQRESEGRISEVDSLGGIVRHERRNHRIALG